MSSSLGFLRNTVIPHKHNNYRPYFLRHPVLFTLSSLFLTSKVGIFLLVSLVPKTAYLSTITSTFLISQTNESRREAGLPVLAPNQELSESARLKAEDMFKKGYFAHVSPSGDSPWKWIDSVNYNYEYAGENLAIDFSTGEGVHQAWLASPGHRKNILSKNYKDIGIAVVTGKFQGRTTTVVVQHFGSLNNAPAVKKPEPVVKSATSKASETLEAPQIIEPTEGQILESGAATVRGLSQTGSTIDLKLDGEKVGGYLSDAGVFGGKFNVPEGENGASYLTAVASLDGQVSPASAPRKVVLDTTKPSIGQDSAIILPNPKDNSSAVFMIPVFGSIKKATASIDGKIIPLSLKGSVALAAIDSSSVPAEKLTVKVEGQNGNSVVKEVTPITKFNVSVQEKNQTNIISSIGKIDSSLKLVFSIIIYILAFLLAVNVLVHVKIQRADLITHVLFVLILGTILFFVT